MDITTERIDAGSQTRPRRTGFAGTGFIADTHARVLQRIPGVNLIAVYDSDPARASAFALKHGIERSCTSLDELFQNVDVVHVLAPPPVHARLAIQALECGKDVLIEKPIAVSTDECRRIAVAALSNGRQVGVNHNATCFPAFRSAVEHIRNWRFGELQHVTALINVGLRQLSKGEHHQWMFHSPENLLLEQAPHPLSQIIFLLGKVKAASVQPSGEVKLKTGATMWDTWQISLVCERGTAQCFISLGRECNDAWLHLIGQDGTAFVDLRRNTLRISEKSRFMEPVDLFLDVSRGAASAAAQAAGNLTKYVLGFLGLKRPADAMFESMFSSISGFYDSMRANVPLPAGLREGTAAIEAYEQILASAEPLLRRTQTRSLYA